MPEQTWREKAEAHSRRVLSDPLLFVDLVRKANAILRDVNSKSDGKWWLVAYEGMRTRERQRELVAKGVSWTYYSRHCVGRAVDFVFWTAKGPSWAEAYPWHLIGSSAKAHGLTWGGTWSEAHRDRPHVQI